MGRTKKSGRKVKQRNKRTKEEWEEMKKQNPELGKSGYKLAPKTNPAFEKFYQGIGIIPEEEWEEFLTVMRKELPATFRITGSRSQAQELLKIIKGQYFEKFLTKERDGVRIEPQPIPWYPEELAWQLDMTKKQIKNDSTLKNLHGFLISETESGNISRQEAVSMIPPLLMDIKPHHKILDMCAAPGSKTAQLIEMLHSDENQPIPEGFVVANDMDNKRCYLMTHQVKRIQSPNCMIINHDARVLPNMSLSANEDTAFLKYDRVLCDVPCSGDGTMRKNPDVWHKWHVNGAYNLHRIQKKVLQRGLELLAVGGQLVYSTCSLNPVEDEAVILALIKQCRGSVEIVDVSDRLPGLKYCKGTYSWKILAKDGNWYETMEQAPANFQTSWDSTIFPPIITEAQEAKLERCVRILPHQQNTGAFFIAVLKKTQKLPWTQNKKDPVINPRVDMEEEVARDPMAKHFNFDYSSRSGLHMFAKCNLCGVVLQGRNDYNSHKQGRKHTQNLAANTQGTDKVEVQVEMVTESSKDSENKSEETAGETEDNAVYSSVGLQSPKVEQSEVTDGTPNGVKATENDSSAITEGTAIKTESGVKSEKMETEQGSSSTVKTEKGTEDGKGDGDCSPPPAKRPKMVVVAGNDEEIQVRMQGHKEDPFIFCGPHDPVWPAIKEFYKISDDLDLQQIMYRNMKRVLYFVSKPVRQLVIANHHKVKFINLGVKCFSNAPSPLVPDCEYRLSQEGLLAIQQYVTARRVSLSKEDLVTILSQENPFIYKLSSRAQDDVYSMSPGSALFHFKPSESEPDLNVEIVFCGWRGKTSVRSFVGKDERSHYLRMCGVELTDIQAKVQAEKAARSLAAGGLVSAGSGAGTDTPLGVPSGDEEEVAQWNKGQEAPRGMEEDDREETKSEGGQAGATEGTAADCDGDGDIAEDKDDKTKDAS